MLRRSICSGVVHPDADLAGARFMDLPRLLSFTEENRLPQCVECAQNRCRFALYDVEYDSCVPSITLIDL